MYTVLKNCGPSIVRTVNTGVKTGKRKKGRRETKKEKKFGNIYTVLTK